MTLGRGHLPQTLHSGIVECQGRDPVAPETDVQSGAIFKRRGEGFVGFAAPDGEGQKRFVLGFDLRGQHSRRGG